MNICFTNPEQVQIRFQRVRSHLLFPKVRGVLLKINIILPSISLPVQCTSDVLTILLFPYSDYIEFVRKYEE